MKKLLLGLLVVFLIGTSMKTVVAQCWIEVGVSWADECVPPPPSLHKYVVDFEIIDACQLPDEVVVYHAEQTHAANVDETTFCIYETLCEENSLVKCYRLKIVVNKVLISTGETLCSDQFTKDYNCEGLMGLNNNEIGVFLN